MRSYLFAKNQRSKKGLLLLLPVILMFVTACGYRGPLYLPGETPSESAAEAPSEPSAPVGIDDSIEIPSDEDEDEDESPEKTSLLKKGS
ncbi:MAG TPA: lipoprotein [Xanthomonadales bacterium]|nr:lipoprotein [Xanthomonadales bacterium]